ncbi:MAG: PP2C family protein-serine/threonine phosphatase [Candidatus Eremiobacterota bacterium]
MEPIMRTGVTLQVVGQIRPAVPEQSGDGFEVTLRPDGTTAIWLLDAQGHGPEACAERQQITSLLKGDASWTSLEPEQALSRADELLAAQGKDGSLAFVQVDPASQKVSVALAGGLPFPMILRADSGALETIEAGGLFVGVGYADIQHDVVQADFRPGDRLVLFSDGITEARDQSETLFTLEGVSRTLHGAADLPPDELLDRLMHASLNHAGRELPEDDSTVIVVEFPMQGRTSAEPTDGGKGGPFTASLGPRS